LEICIIWVKIVPQYLNVRFNNMKKMKIDVLEFLRKNQRVRHAIAELFVSASGARLADVTVLLWIKKNDPRLTCISVLELVSEWIGKPIDDLTTEV